MGRPTTVLDPNGLASYTYYDSLGRPIQTQQPVNTGSSSPTVTGFAYNANQWVLVELFISRSELVLEPTLVWRPTPRAMCAFIRMLATLLDREYQSVVVS